ncbi:pyrroline-5-carboxylate reductase [Streptococcus rifensis]
MKIGFIGVGNMGAAIAKSIDAAKYTLYLSSHNPQKAAVLQAHIPNAVLGSNQEIAASCDMIFLGVKPYQVTELLRTLAPAIAQNKKALWVSMSAGLPLSKIAELLPSEAGLIRMMPNTPVAVGQGMTTYCLSESARAERDNQLFTEVMANSGKLLALPESSIDAATGIAGCGPAFVFQMIEALADAGVQNGLQRADALELSAQTLLGAAQLMLETGTHPSVLRDQVTSPGGSTIAGVVALEENGFRHATISAVNAAIERTRALGN